MTKPMMIWYAQSKTDRIEIGGIEQKIESRDTLNQCCLGITVVPNALPAAVCPISVGNQFLLYLTRPSMSVACGSFTASLFMDEFDVVDRLVSMANTYLLQSVILICR
jgi:hypothetical protein